MKEKVIIDTKKSIVVLILLLLPCLSYLYAEDSIDDMTDADKLGFDEIVFIKRKPYSSDHNYTMAFNGTSADRFLAENGIYSYNLKTKQTRAIITAADMPGDNL